LSFSLAYERDVDLAAMLFEGSWEMFFTKSWIEMILLTFAEEASAKSKDYYVGRIYSNLSFNSVN
jgi:hypothetical protein